MKKILDDINTKLDLDRTNELFDSSIDKADSFSKEKYDEHSLRSGKLCLGFGNLHVNTAKAKLGAIRMIGYKDVIQKLKSNIDKKVRNSRKYRK